MLVAKIDENGYFVEDVILQNGGEIPFDCVVERPDTTVKSFYKAKWTGTEWVEGMSQEEIDEFKNQPRELTEIEKQQEIINTLGQELAQLKLQILLGGM